MYIDRNLKKKRILESLYAKYNFRDLVKPDPLQFVYNYSNPADMEIAGFLASALAYGRVRQIEKSLTDLFVRMGQSPYQFVINFDKSQRKKLIAFKHRFTSGEDISDLLELLKRVFQEFGSIENLFCLGYSIDDKNIVSALSKFRNTLVEIYTKTSNRSLTRSFAYLLPDPEAGSACKRLNLFLRWMVREDNIDTGLWKKIDKSKLVIPVDVHMSRLCRFLGFYDNKTVSMKTAIKITDGFSQLQPHDPVKYDFALSRIGIIENCNGSYRPQCEDCQLLEFCFEKKGQP